MAICKNKFVGIALAATMTFTSLSPLLTNDVNVVYAAESKALGDARAKISHLTHSLKTNYLGLKNQGVWQTYISQSRELIKKISSSEKSQINALTEEVNRAEALVNALSRINQVEKSMQPKSEGGYGNYLGIKNAETWNRYLSLAEADLKKVDKSIFRNQYDELVRRMNKAAEVVKGIEDKFQTEYNKVVKLYNEARSSWDLAKAKEALKEAEKLGTCDRSNSLEKNIKKLINDITASQNNNNNNSGNDSNSGSDSNASSDVQKIEAKVAEIVNAERAKAGLKPLTLDKSISNVARTKSQDMANKNYFSHTSPTYGSPFDMMKKFGINYTSAGENIAKGQTSAETVMNAWMNSSGHRANILSSNFGKIGVGYVVKNGTTYWTQMFTN